MAEIAGGHLDTLMPGYTHLQHAQPTTLAHYLASYVWRLHRDASRIKAAYNGVNTNPLGAAAMSSTTLPIDPRITTRLLGFRAVDENSMDSVSSRDFLLESLSAIGILAVAASRLASDLILWSTAEFGFTRLSDAYSSTSSIMPQKRNPDSLELCRARCHTIAGALNAALATCTGLPSTYNRDLQEVTLHLWRGSEATVSILAVLGGALASATFDPEAMERAASSGMLWATDLADELVTKSNIPFRTAHAVVARVARECEDGYDSPLVARLVRSAVREMTGSDVTIQDSVVKEIMALAPRIADRRGGGPSPRSVARSLERARKAVSRNRNWRQQKLDEIESARAKVRDAQESLRS
jgi:argininosuccinate lyase